MQLANQKYNRRYLTAAFVVFLVIWIGWAVDAATRFTVPGLLDDGTYITTAEHYRAAGFFHVLTSHFLQIFNRRTPVRFYELHTSLLGLYGLVFGLDLRFWYLVQFGYCLLTAAAGLWIVWSFSKNLPAAMLTVFAVLTVSPLADAVRANFGKVEDVMTFTLMAGVAFLVRLRFRWASTPTIRDRVIVVCVAIAATIFITLGALGKESGKILATFPLLFVVLEFGALKVANWRKSWQPRHPRVEGIFLDRGEEKLTPIPDGFIAFSLCLGVIVLGISIYAFRIPDDTGYLGRYFKLDFDPRFMLASLHFYLVQCPDEFILLAMLAPIIALGYLKPRVWACCASLTTIAAVYVALLTTFHFQISYYVYIPAVLTAVAYGLAFTCSSRGYKIALLAALALSRTHSIPYIYFQAAGQRYVDYVNFMAMSAAARSDATRVIMLDLDEDNQAIQEWNLLSRSYFDEKLPPVFGGPPNFRISEYQKRIRDESHLNGYAANRPDATAARDSVPRVGDLVAVRSGSVMAGSRTLRAVFPFRQDESKFLSVLDPNSLTLFARVGGDVPGVTPFGFGVARFDLHWNFYRVSSPPRYVILGRESPGWLRRDAKVRVLQAVPGGQLALRIEIPGWVPYHYPLILTARMDGATVERLVVTQGSIQTLVLPLDKRGDIALDSSDCSAPRKIGVVGPVELCYLLVSATEQQKATQ